MVEAQGIETSDTQLEEKLKIQLFAGNWEEEWLNSEELQNPKPLQN